MCYSAGKARFGVAMVASVRSIEEDRHLVALLRCLAIALVVLAAMPASALGASVTRDDSTGIISVEDNSGAVDNITVSTENGQHVFMSDPGGLTGDGAACLPGIATDKVTCTAGSS